MLGGMIIGGIFGGVLPARLVKATVMAAIFLLLFLLGVSIGSDAALFAALPTLGWSAAVIAFFCSLGSVLCARLIRPFLPRNKKNAR